MTAIAFRGEWRHLPVGVCWWIIPRAFAFGFPLPYNHLRKAVAQVLQENGIRFPSLQEDGDEVVIQAGCVRASEGHPSQDVPREGERVAVGNADTGKPASSQAPVADGPAGVSSATGHGRRFEGMATTEQDLNGQVPFSGMRRVIMILAAVAIAAMVAYCLINR